MRIAAGAAVALAAAGAAPPAVAGQSFTLHLPAGLDAYVPIPPENPMTDRSVTLGRRLFFDSSLSVDGRIACASCHDPRRAFADSARFSPGVNGQRGRRNTPTLVNAAWSRSFFLDGRVATLEEQVLRPIEDPLEMDGRIADVIARLRSDPSYAASFRAAYGEEASRMTLARALASFVRTILSGDSPFDRFRAGTAGALSPQALAGYRLFAGRANCATCHVGPTLSNQRFHNTGAGWRDDGPADSGRYTVTRRPADLGAFKTPTLRNVERTGPYMHDGSLETLEEVIEFYDAGGRANPYLDPEIRPLRLTDDEKEALLAYLRSLTGIVVSHGDGNPSRHPDAGKRRSLRGRTAIRPRPE